MRVKSPVVGWVQRAFSLGALRTQSMLLTKCFLKIKVNLARVTHHISRAPHTLQLAPHNSKLAPLLPRQVIDQFHQRYEERDHDKADGTAQEDDEQRLHQLGESIGQYRDFFVVGIGHFVQHGVEFAGLFADVDHVHDDVVDNALPVFHHVNQNAHGSADEAEPEECRNGMEAELGVFFHRQRDGIALFDAIADAQVEFFEDGIAAGFAGDVECFENRHTAGDERAEGPRSAGHDVFLDELAEDGHLGPLSSL